MKKKSRDRLLVLIKYACLLKQILNIQDCILVLIEDGGGLLNWEEINVIEVENEDQDFKKG